MKLSECRAVITGASGGIGQALLKALLAEGAQLLLHQYYAVPPRTPNADGHTTFKSQLRELLHCHL